jgi:hypothetical protein
VNPGVSRLVIVAALVLAGVAVLVNGFSDDTSQAAPSPSTSPTPTESPTPTAAPDDEVVGEKDAFVQVFNGTNAAGFAATFLEQLLNNGYQRAGEPMDAPDKPVVESIVYFKRDQTTNQNRADAELLARDSLLETTPVEPLPADYADIVDPAADVVVVLGEDVVPTD